MNTNKNQVAFQTFSRTNIWGHPAQRMMAVYRTAGCAYDKKRKGCTMCNFAHYAAPGIEDADILRQHETIVEELENTEVEHFDLLTLGNFFHDGEISPELQKSLLSPLKEIPSLRRILVESRIQYVSKEELRSAKSMLREDQILEYAFGYESVTERIRNGVLNKGVKEADLDRALALCHSEGIDFVAYILIKPQTLTEEEGIVDAVKSAVHVLNKARNVGVRARVAFEPLFVVSGKPIEAAFLAGTYRPPWLWSVIEVLKRTVRELGSNFQKGALFVGLSDENLSEKRFAHNCDKCGVRIRKSIQNFNGSQDIGEFSSLDCACKKEWAREVAGA